MAVALTRRLVVAGLFGLLAFAAFAIAYNWLTRGGASSIPVAWWAIGALVLAGCAIGLRSAWSGRPLELIAALALVGTAWAVHSVWRMRSVPEDLRAVTFGGDVVQSAFAFMLLAITTLWASGTVRLNLRAPPP